MHVVVADKSLIEADRPTNGLTGHTLHSSLPSPLRKTAGIAPRCRHCFEASLRPIMASELLEVKDPGKSGGYDELMIALFESSWLLR
ncbi:hypothetical protein HYQ44_018315 [Verticillium longisporum]|nr:hypothetical protein HYQ44_018315 [Verticillium longisporum]